MKTILILLLFSFPFCVKGQSFWNLVIDDDSYNISHVTDEGLFQDSLIVVSGFVSDASCPYHNLFAFNLKGEELWNVRGYHDLIFTDSLHIYTIGYTPIDDVMGREQIVLAKYDKNGNEVFSRGYPEIPHDFYFQFEPRSIYIADDGTILVSSKRSVIKSSTDGAQIKEYELNTESDIEGIVSMNPNSYMVYSQHRIYRSDSSFVLQDSIEFTGGINQILVKNDTLHALLNSGIVRLDSTLNVIDTLVTTAVGFEDMKIFGDDLWVRTSDTDSVRLIQLNSGAVVDTFAFELLSQIKGFTVAQNNFTFIGDSFTSQIGLYNYQSGNTVNVKLPDIEIIDFEIDSITHEYITSPPEDSILAGIHFNTELTVENKGTDTIYTLAVFSDLRGGFNCVQNYFYQKFTDIEIPPGQVQTLKLKRAYQEVYNSTEICFQCLAPNSKLEKVVNNNSQCKTIVVTGVDNKIQSSVKIYPNPFYDYLVIESPDINKKNIELTDINGKAVLKKAATDRRIVIETGELTSGSYVLKIISGGKSSSYVIIKNSKY